MRRARALVEIGLVWSGVAHLAARRVRGRTLVLAYHNILPDGVRATGDRSLHLGQTQFAAQLDVLAAACDVIPLRSILVDSPVDARPRVAITFDDAYRGALTVGAAELRARGLPATMFAPPGLLDTESFWWDALAGPDGLSDRVRQHVLDELCGDGDAVRDWAARTGHAMHDVADPERPGTEGELLAWARTDGMSIGAHTWRHANLSRLTDRGVEEELTRPMRWLKARAPKSAVPWLTYPYGLATPTVAAAARAVGYEAALAVAGGWLPHPRGDAYRLPRLNIPAGLTTHGFRLRLAGLMGEGVAVLQHQASSRTLAAV